MMAAVFMRDKRNVFCSNPIPKSFYNPSLPRQTDGGLPMKHECQQDNDVISSSTNVNWLGTSMDADKNAKEDLGASFELQDFLRDQRLSERQELSEEPAMTKYVSRFWHGQPTSRQHRKSQNNHPLWWKSIRDDDPVASQSPNPPSTTTSSSSDLHPTIHVQKPGSVPSECVLNKISESSSLLPPPAIPTAFQLQSSIPDPGALSYAASNMDEEPKRAPHIGCLISARGNDDILYQWRLKRKLELARDLSKSQPPEPALGGTNQCDLQMDQFYSSKLSNFHLHPSTTHLEDNIHISVKASDLSIPQHDLEQSYEQQPSPQHGMPAVQTITEHKDAGSQTVASLFFESSQLPVISHTNIRWPSVLYPTTSTSLSDTIFTDLMDLSELTVVAPKVALDHPPLCSRDVHLCLPLTSPNSGAGGLHDGTTLMSARNDELLQILMMRARHFEAQLRQIDAQLAAIEQPPL